MLDNLIKRQDEPELAYIYRLGRMKDNGVIDMTWSDLTNILNKQLRDPDEEWAESSYRKKYNLIRDAYE